MVHLLEDQRYWACSYRFRLALPIRETIRKGARTFATVLAMMDRYPDYVFGASQPQLYQWMKDYDRQLYKKIQAQESPKGVGDLGCNVGRGRHQYLWRRSSGAPDHLWQALLP